MVHFYPVTNSEMENDEYAVEINGKEVQLNHARASAYPFNRRWPGHQRDIKQSETISFILLEADEKLDFEITAKTPFSSVKIRPQSLHITPNIIDNKISFSLDQPAYFTVEPFGRKNALHIFVDPVSADVPEIDENTIYFGAGEHMAGTIQLKSSQTLFIDEGAVVYGCVSAIDADNIRIIGKGILDNSKNKEIITFETNAEGNTAAVNNAKRQHTIQLEYCNNVEIDGITIRDSLIYNIRPIGCKNLNISNVKILGCWRYNSDGIDMHNCENVLIDNCFIRTFDDCICVKGFDCYYDGDVEEAIRDAMYRNGKSYDVFKNVLIRNCVLWNDWGKCLEIGAETRAEEICDIVFENCDVIHVTGPVLDCMNVDYAAVHDVVYKNINIEADEELLTPMIQNRDTDRYVNAGTEYMPPMISVEVVYHEEYSAKGKRRGKNTNITFENIRILSAKKPLFIFGGYDTLHKTSDIILKNILVNGIKIYDKSQYEIKTDEFCENIVIE